jgi:tetratricopeptide (TPR) repeat protein
MSRDQSWYRRTSWTAADEAQFEQRNRRSRGPDRKAQYMRIQADTLRQTAKPELVQVALKMLERSFREFPDAMDCAAAFECAGRCCEQIGDFEQAIDFYRRALARERVFPGLITSACFRFGKLVVEHRREDLYEDVLAAIERFGQLAFPWHVYMANAIRAIIAAERGNLASARQLTRTAMEAAHVRDAGWGLDGIGVVTKERDTRLHEMLDQLGDA